MQDVTLLQFRSSKMVAVNVKDRMAWCHRMHAASQSIWKDVLELQNQFFFYCAKRFIELHLELKIVFVLTETF